MSNTAIRVEQLGKQYHIGRTHQRYDRIGEQLAAIAAAPLRRLRRMSRSQATGRAGLDPTIWAIKDIHFEIKRGEVVGIIGRNGAGKSTLLKILSRITEPSTGFAEIHGRVGSLLEVGTGFHPELTGRENVFLNGAILGMSTRETERKFDEIVAFAEIDKFIDTPVKQYSSGMYVRLAFAVAAHLEPEILLIDEVLAVGDVGFQKKCLGRIADVANEGRTVLFVSHNLGLVQTLCQRGIYIQEGKLCADCNIKDAVAAYLRDLEQTQMQSLAERTDRQGAGRIRLTNVQITGPGDPPQHVLKTGEPARFVFSLSDLTADTSCVFVVFDQFGHPVAVFKSDVPGPEDVIDATLGTQIICEMDTLFLLPGHYRINVQIRGGGEKQDAVEAAATFDVESGHLWGRPVSRTVRHHTSVSMPHRWRLPVST